MAAYSYVSLLESMQQTEGDRMTALTSTLSTVLRQNKDYFQQVQQLLDKLYAKTNEVDYLKDVQVFISRYVVAELPGLCEIHVGMDWLDSRSCLF